MQESRYQKNRLAQFLSSKRGSTLREYLTAYLMIAPAIILIFIFGIFPVGFALYVSVHKWRIIQGDFFGLNNYTDALSSLAYIVLFVLGVGALIGAYLLLRRCVREFDQAQRRNWFLAIPGLLHAAALGAFFRWLFFQMPEFLDIAQKMRGLERTRELFVGLLNEAFFAETVYPHWQSFSLLAVVSILSAVAFIFLLRFRGTWNLQMRFTGMFLAAGVGIGLLINTFNTISEVYAQALVEGTDPGIWPQLVTVTSGALLLVLAWRLWRGAERRDSNLAVALRIIAAVGLMVGAVMLIVEVPTIVAAGDEDLWNGLKVTVFFSMSTVPFQLTIALFLSVLLFQGFRGSGIFRVIYFLPYVTPAVASAAVFRFLFSDRAVSPANRFLGLFGIEPQAWLREADGMFAKIASSLGMQDFPNSLIPSWFPESFGNLLADWMNGPSQALMVVIILSIWTFVGYNVVIYLAGLANIPNELTEAAEIDGATKWDVFRHITFPLLSPTTYFLSLIAVMGTFKAFNTIWVLRSRAGSALGTMNTFSVVIFEEFFLKTRYGYASALAFILFGIILILTYFNNRIQGSKVFYG